MKSWDDKKTLRQNYEALGLTLDLNTKEELAPVVNTNPAVVEFATLAEFTKQSLEVSKRPSNFVSEEETLYLERCVSFWAPHRPQVSYFELACGPRTCGRLMKAHGDNYKAMERDIKRNNMQHSATHLQSRIARLVRYKESVGGGGGVGVAAPSS